MCVFQDNEKWNGMLRSNSEFVAKNSCWQTQEMQNKVVTVLINSTKGRQ